MMNNFDHEKLDVYQVSIDFIGFTAEVLARISHKPSTTVAATPAFTAFASKADLNVFQYAITRLSSAAL
jgi:hypothetical protein